jgi:hypothetical protein
MEQRYPSVQHVPQFYTPPSDNPYTQPLNIQSVFPPIPPVQTKFSLNNRLTPERYNDLPADQFLVKTRGDLEELGITKPELSNKEEKKPKQKSKKRYKKKTSRDKPKNLLNEEKNGAKEKSYTQKLNLKDLIEHTNNDIQVESEKKRKKEDKNGAFEEWYKNKKKLELLPDQNKSDITIEELRERLQNKKTPQVVRDKQEKPDQTMKGLREYFGINWVPQSEQPQVMGNKSGKS